MFRKLPLAIFITIALSYSATFGQGYQTITPSSVGVGTGSGPLNQIFDISDKFGLTAGSGAVTMTVNNAFVNQNNDTWTVSETESTTFILGGTVSVEAFAQHGGNLGSNDGTNGSGSRDGITTSTGENWSLVSNLDNDYTAGQSGNTYFVDYTGGDTGGVEGNSEPFRWESNQVISNFTVFSDNTTALNNNYTVGFRTVAVPEPSTGLLAAMVTGLFFVRRKRS